MNREPQAQQFDEVAPGAQITELEELYVLAQQVTPKVRGFLESIVDVGSGRDPESAVAVLILALSDVLYAGALLGAYQDILPPERFEPDSGLDVDLEPLRIALITVLDGLDTYLEVVDPQLGAEVGMGSLSSDLTIITENLTHGLQHFDRGHEIEALWWWQYAYLSNWGERAASALRVLQILLGHLRLDVPDDVAQEAQFEALTQLPGLTQLP